MSNHLQQAVQNISDVKAAATLVATGTTGSFIQVLTEWANHFVAIGNAVLVLGGFYLMYNKILDGRRTRRKGDDG